MTSDRPDERRIGVVVPAELQRRELGEPQDDRQAAEADEQQRGPSADVAGVAPPAPPGRPRPSGRQLAEQEGRFDGRDAQARGAGRAPTGPASASGGGQSATSCQV